MPYASRDDVKVVRLKIPSGDTNEDSNIDGFIAEADAMLDEIHKRYGLSVPVANPSETLRSTSAEVAANLFRLHRMLGPEFHEAIWRSIRQLLSEYEADVFVKGGGLTLTSGADQAGGD